MKQWKIQNVAVALVVEHARYESPLEKYAGSSFLLFPFLCVDPREAARGDKPRTQERYTGFVDNEFHFFIVDIALWDLFVTQSGL